MSRSGINKVIILGNLGNDPELNNGCCKFSVATSETYNDQERTEWHRIVTFGKLAEICQQYLLKGHKVYLEGKNQTNKWTDKEGVERYSTEVLCNEMQMLGSPKTGPSDPRESARPYG